MYTDGVKKLDRFIEHLDSVFLLSLNESKQKCCKGQQDKFDKKNLGFEIQVTVAAIQTARVDQIVWISEP